MLTRILPLIIALILLPTLYVHCLYVLPCTRWGAWRWLTFLPAACLTAYFLWAMQYEDLRPQAQPIIGAFVFVLLLCTVPALLFCIVDVLGRFVGWIAGLCLSGHAPLIQRPARILALTVALIAALILLHGYFLGSRHYVVHRQTIYFDNLPEAFDGYRIALFSDMHIGTFSTDRREEVQRIVDLINSTECDIILFAGDLVTAYADELSGHEQALASLHAPDGVVSILGNHDYPLYGRHTTRAEQIGHMRQLIDRERSFGWTLLRNENISISRQGERIAICGVENDGTPPFPQLADLPKATQGIPASMRYALSHHADGSLPHTFTILLSHDPTHWRRRVLPDTYIDLTLSGHTHAGQFKLLGWSPVSHVYNEWSGTYVQGSQVLCVSDGVGETLFPFRFGAWPQINVITLRRGNPSDAHDDTL